MQVRDVFNPDAFIDARGFPSLEALADEVRAIADDESRCAMPAGTAPNPTPPTRPPASPRRALRARSAPVSIYLFSRI